MEYNDKTTAIQNSRKAALDFLRAGRRKERKQKTAASKETGFDLSERFRKMSDEDFDKGVADGTITPDQIRKAGEYEHDVYMGDVWMENPDNDDKPEPSYEEFMSDPGKYGYSEDAYEPRKIYRYNPSRYKK